MAEKILTNELKTDETLPIGQPSAELFIHPITSGISKISGGAELSFEQKLTDDNDDTMDEMKGGLSFYSDNSKLVAFRIYHDTNNGKLLIPSRGGGIVIGGGGILLQGSFADTAQMASLSETILNTGGTTSSVALTVFDTNVEITSTDASTIPLVRFDTLITDQQTSMLIRRNNAGTYTLQRVSLGAADSGGTGFKLLRVPN